MSPVILLIASLYSSYFVYGSTQYKTQELFEDKIKSAKSPLSVPISTNIPFDIFTTDGQYIKTFNYQFEAREFLQKEYSITTFINICEVLSGKRKSSAGFLFKYK